MAVEADFSNNDNRDSYEVLRIVDFRNFLAARFCNTLAIQIQSVAVGWQMYELTRDPLALGFIGLAEAVPAITCALYAGHVADRTNRRTMTLVAMGAYFVCTILLLALSYFALGANSMLGSALGNNALLGLYAIIFCTGIARSFEHPALFALSPQLVPPRLYAQSAAWNSTIWETGSIAGPALGGFVYAGFGVNGAYVLVVGLMLSALICTLRIRKPADPVPRPHESVQASIREGLRFVLGNEAILGSITLDMFAVLFGGAMAMLPVVAAEVLHVGPQGLGLLRAAPSVGAVMIAFFIAHRPLGRHAGRILLACVAGFGTCMLAFGLSTNFYVSLFVLGLSGVFDSVSVIIRSTIIQTLTPDAMRGRVAAVNSIFIVSSNELGAFESGVAARLMGIQPSIIAGGVVTLAVVLVMLRFAPKLRNIGFE
jgi:MFS family permease